MDEKPPESHVSVGSPDPRGDYGVLRQPVPSKERDNPDNAAAYDDDGNPIDGEGDPTLYPHPIGPYGETIPIPVTDDPAVHPDTNSDNRAPEYGNSSSEYIGFSFTYDWKFCISYFLDTYRNAAATTTDWEAASAR